MHALDNLGTSPWACEGVPINVLYVFHSTRKLGLESDVRLDGTAERSASIDTTGASSLRFLCCLYWVGRLILLRH